MTKALALAIPTRDLALEALRMAIVYGCALALIAAGPVLPALGV